jgi:formamidopyrimidine-DNA glycosylase
VGKEIWNNHSKLENMTIIDYLRMEGSLCLTNDNKVDGDHSAIIFNVGVENVREKEIHVEWR